MIHYGLSDAKSRTVQELSYRALLHGFELKRKQDISKLQEELSKSEDFSEEFRGVMCHTGANWTNFMSLKLYLAYCVEHLRLAALHIPKLDTSKTTTLQGFAWSQRKIGTACIEIPITVRGIDPLVTFHIVAQNCSNILLPARKEATKTRIIE